MIYAVVVAALAISSSFERLVIMANVSALLLYLLCVAASYELQRRDVRMAGDTFQSAGGAADSAAAAAGIIWLLLQATARELQSFGHRAVGGERVLRGIDVSVDRGSLPAFGFAGAGPVTSLGPGFN